MLTLHQKLYISKKVTCVPVLQQSSHSAHTADTLVSQRFSNPFIQFGTREITSKWHIAAVLSCSFYLSPCAICSFWCAPTHFLVLQILLKKKKAKHPLKWHSLRQISLLYRSTISNGNYDQISSLHRNSLLDFLLGEKEAKRSSCILHAIKAEWQL